MAERDFENFKKRVNEIAAESLNRNGLTRKVVSSGYLRKTSEEIEEILSHANEEELRNLSQSYWDLSGLYKRMLIYMANMLHPNKMGMDAIYNEVMNSIDLNIGA